jgi:hypothetical protein
MAKKLDEYHFLIFLITKIEEGNHNNFHFDEKFLKQIEKKYKGTTKELLERIIIKCKIHKWMNSQGIGQDCPYQITERGKGVAISKRKEFDANFGKRVNKFIGDYKNIIYLIGFCVTLFLAYIKIRGQG